jgi:asparagine N-glycosylation enzyme membrane subunit Stt3
VSATEKLLKAILLVAFACYVVSLILEDWRGALGSAVLGLATGVVLVERKLRGLERRVRELEDKAG